MGWLQKMPQSGTPMTQLYTLETTGQHQRILIVGLGNPGKSYEGTRHNIGFLCIDSFVSMNEDMGAWTDKKGLRCLLSEGRLGSTQVITIKPTTFMNVSGEAVRAAADFYRIKPEQTLVVHDELDISFGQIRLRQGGASAGHNGIKSVSEAIGEEYGRVRVGIGPKQPEQIDSAGFVLQKFTKDEQAQLPNLIRETNAILTEYIFSGQLPHDTRNFLI